MHIQYPGSVGREFRNWVKPKRSAVTDIVIDPKLFDW